MVISDKIEVLSTEYVYPIVDDGHQQPAPQRHPKTLPPLRPRTQSWVDSEASASGASSSPPMLPRPRIIRRRRTRQPRPYLLRIKIAGLNNYYRSTLLSAKLFWALIVATAMTMLAFMIYRHFDARFINDTDGIRVGFMNQVRKDRMNYPRMKICVRPTVPGKEIKRHSFKFPCPLGRENREIGEVSDYWAEKYGSYLTAAWSASSFWWPADQDNGTVSLMFGNDAPCANKAFHHNLVDGTGLIRFLHRYGAPACDKFFVGCRVGKSAYDCCNSEKALSDNPQFNSDPSAVFDSRGRCYTLAMAEYSGQEGLQEAQNIDLHYTPDVPNDAILIFDDTSNLAPIPLPRGHHIIISLKKQHISTLGNLRAKQYDHTCMEKCAAEAVVAMCGCRSAAAMPLGAMGNSSAEICSPLTEIICGIDAKLSATDPTLSEMEHGYILASSDIRYRKGHFFHPCWHCNPTTDYVSDQVRLDARVTFMPLVSGSRKLGSDSDKTRVSIVYPEFSIDEIVYEAVGRVSYEPWKLRGLMAFFGMLSVISVIQSVCYAHMAIITRRCTPKPVHCQSKKAGPKPSRKGNTLVSSTAVHEATEPVPHPVVNTRIPKVVISYQFCDEEQHQEHPSVGPGAHTSNDTIDVASVNGGLAPPRTHRSSVVAWMSYETDPNISRPSSAQRNIVMATCLNKFVALPYTDDEPAKERTRVDTVTPFDDPKANKKETDATSDASSSGHSCSVSLVKRRVSLQDYFQKVASGIRRQTVGTIVKAEPVTVFMDPNDRGEGSSLKPFTKRRRQSMPAVIVSPLYDGRLPDVAAFSNKVTSTPNVGTLFRRHSNLLQVPEAGFTGTLYQGGGDTGHQTPITQMWSALIADGAHGDKTMPNAEASPTAKLNIVQLLSLQRPFLAQIRESTNEGQKSSGEAEGSWFSENNSSNGSRKSSVPGEILEEGSDSVTVPRRKCSSEMPISEISEQEL